MLPIVNHPILRAFFENTPSCPRVRVMSPRFWSSRPLASSTSTRSRSKDSENAAVFALSTPAMRRSSEARASCKERSDCSRGGPGFASVASGAGRRCRRAGASIVGASATGVSTAGGVASSFTGSGSVGAAACTASPSYRYSFQYSSRGTGWAGRRTTTLSRLSAASRTRWMRGRASDVVGTLLAMRSAFAAAARIACTRSASAAAPSARALAMCACSSRTMRSSASRYLARLCGACSARTSGSSRAR